MAQDIFLKINGIEGESQDTDHKNEIEILAFNWKAFQESTMHAGSGGGAGKATVEDLEFDHFVDRSSPNLMKYCLTGKHVQEAKLTVRKAGGNPLEYLKFTFTDVIITSIQPFGSNCGDRWLRHQGQQGVLTSPAPCRAMREGASHGMGCACP